MLKALNIPVDAQPPLLKKVMDLLNELADKHDLSMFFFCAQKIMSEDEKEAYVAAGSIRHMHPEMGEAIGQQMAKDSPELGEAVLKGFVIGSIPASVRREIKSGVEEVVDAAAKPSTMH